MTDAKDIFLRAIECSSPDERVQLIDNACGADAALRRRVDALLAAHDDPESYLERPAARFDVTATHDGSGSHLSDSSSSHHGRFLPGTKVAGRYRIVSMLGRGGMGEVYRADDLRLGQTVALKFLPTELAKDAKRLVYFHNEVRLARQIAHPNVCRVYDIGEVDGQHFISMEYIDGEDLKTLLHRIGRVPADKGVQIAQQICAGIAAAHAKGVLHRDLKPANIMIDGQGQVRITDFGLATFTGDSENIIGMSGTPAYMAPEQLLRGQTSVQSDIYSLGLILHELFTGKCLHNASSIPELRRFHEETSQPTSSTDWPSDMDPAAHRAICNCLEADPADRPTSASVLAGALPGGDPLAAALAAGETPSPELVAASGGTGTLRIPVVIACLAAVCVALSIVFYFSDTTHLASLSQLSRPPEFLHERAKDVVDDLGYEQIGDIGKAAGFSVDWSAFRFIRDKIEQDPDLDVQAEYRSSPWPVLEFWYRQSPSALVSERYRHGDYGSIRTAVTKDTPSWDEDGMIGVRLTPDGYVRRFHAFVSPAPSESDDAMDVKFEEWFSETVIGFDLAALEPCSSVGIPHPRIAYDRLQSWTGNWPDSDIPLKVTAASNRGKPVYFKVLSPDETVLQDRNRQGSRRLAFWIPAAANAIALCLAGVHYVTGSGDRRGAFRLASCVSLAECVAWLLDASHVLSAESTLARIGVANALFDGCLAGMLYMAVEPLVRRDWPELLISLSRLLRGRCVDARIGQDALVGSFVGPLIVICFWIVPKPFGMHRVIWDGLRVLTNDGSFTSTVLGSFRETGVAGLSILFTYWLCFRLTRSKVAAFCIMVVLGTIVVASPRGLWSRALPWQVFSMMLLMGAVARFGVLAGAFAMLSHRMVSMPITSDPQSFFFAEGLLALVIVLIVAVFGAYASLRGSVRRLGPQYQ